MLRATVQLMTLSFAVSAVCSAPVPGTRRGISSTCAIASNPGHNSATQLKDLGSPLLADPSESQQSSVNMQDAEESQEASDSANSDTKVSILQTLINLIPSLSGIGKAFHLSALAANSINVQPSGSSATSRFNAGMSPIVGRRRHQLSPLLSQAAKATASSQCSMSSMPDVQQSDLYEHSPVYIQHRVSRQTLIHAETLLAIQATLTTQEQICDALGEGDIETALGLACACSNLLDRLPITRRDIADALKSVNDTVVAVSNPVTASEFLTRFALYRLSIVSQSQADCLEQIVSSCRNPHWLNANWIALIDEITMASAASLDIAQILQGLFSEAMCIEDFEAARTYLRFLDAISSTDVTLDTIVRLASDHKRTMFDELIYRAAELGNRDGITLWLQLQSRHTDELPKNKFLRILSVLDSSGHTELANDILGIVQDTDYSSNIMAILLVARALIHTGRFALAKQLLDSIDTATLSEEELYNYYIQVANLFSKTRDEKHLRMLVEQAIDSKVSDRTLMFVLAHLVTVVVQLHSPTAALRLIQEFATRGIGPFVDHYSIVLHHFQLAGDFEQADRLFRDILDKQLKPGLVTFTIMMNFASNSGNLKYGEWLLEQLQTELHNFELDDMFLKKLMFFYGKVIRDPSLLLDRFLKLLEMTQEPKLLLWSLNCAVHTRRLDDALHIWQVGTNNRFLWNDPVVDELIVRCNEAGRTADVKRIAVYQNAVQRLDDRHRP